MLHPIDFYYNVSRLILSMNAVNSKHYEIKKINKIIIIRINSSHI